MTLGKLSFDARTRKNGSYLVTTVGAFLLLRLQLYDISEALKDFSTGLIALIGMVFVHSSKCSQFRRIASPVVRWTLSGTPAVLVKLTIC